MAAIFERVASTAAISDELAALAERVRASVVVVRGSRFGGGSGVVWNDRGLIITNDHVIAPPGRSRGFVADSGRVEVEARDGERFPALVVARSRELDLAALLVDGATTPRQLTPATIADSSKLQVGELVVAVGNPLGERNAVTLGVVGGTGPIDWDGEARDLLRLGITLRPGNSGGALADVRGRIVGIPNMVIRPGLALAVPSAVVEQFLRGSKV